MNKTISIIVPVHNEAQNIPLLHAALIDVWRTISHYDYELIFVDDGSTDESLAAIRALEKSDPRVSSIEFTRNFGKEMATTAGLRASVGDAAIMIDADMQHPPRLIPQFIDAWEKGAEMVVGIRTQNEGANFINRLYSNSFYKILNAISDIDVRKGETDFRLVDRAVIDEFNKLREHERMTRSLINWLGFRKECILFEAPERAHGEVQYTFSKLVHLALYSFITHSFLPLKVAGYLGGAITVFAGILGAIVAINRYALGDALGWHISGPAQLALLILFLVGIVLMCLGVIGLYVGTISQETSGRPLYVVRKRKEEK